MHREHMLRYCCFGCFIRFKQISIEERSEMLLSPFQRELPQPVKRQQRLCVELKQLPAYVSSLILSPSFLRPVNL